MGFLGGAFDWVDDALDGVGTAIDDVVGGIFGDGGWGDVFQMGSDVLKTVMGGGASGQMDSYRSMAANAYRPREFPYSDIEPPGTNKVVGSVDIQGLHSQWLSRMRDFAYLKNIHDDTKGK